MLELNSVGVAKNYHACSAASGTAPAIEAAGSESTSRFRSDQGHRA